ncbi:MAG: glycosyltransferase, partial [Flavisolibacter sp.]
MQEAEKKHIVWLCSGLHQPGGTERANLNAAHLLLQHGLRVTIIVMDETGESFYPVDENINLVHRKWFFGIGGNGNVISRKGSMLREFYALKKLLVSLEPYAIVATDYSYAVACVFTGLHKKYKVYSWEHHHYHWLKKSRFWQMMIRYAYPRLQSVLVYNPDESPWYIRMGCRTDVIP